MGFSSLIVYEVMPGRIEPIDPHPSVVLVLAKAPTNPPDNSLAEVKREEWLNTILGRPLFNPDRKPVITGQIQGLPRLTGIVIASTGNIAIFAGPPNSPAVVTQVGSNIAAFKVTSITVEGVTVVGPTGTLLLKPIFNVAVPPTPEVPPPPKSIRRKIPASSG